MSFNHTIDTSTMNLSSLMDRSAHIGAEMINLSVRNFESAARAGRELSGARSFGDAARIQMDYVRDLMSAFTDHSEKIAEIAMAGVREAGADAKAAGESVVRAAQEATQKTTDETAKGLNAVRKF
jgi:hypothetical protein